MDWGQDLLIDPVVPSAGVARARDKPGAGIEFNETALQRCIVAA
jgi:L-alanine-DL-glutamate epimerase-like enolase superfamily enzyme